MLVKLKEVLDQEEPASLEAKVLLGKAFLLSKEVHWEKHFQFFIGCNSGSRKSKGI